MLLVGGTEIGWSAVAIDSNTMAGGGPSQYSSRQSNFMMPSGTGPVVLCSWPGSNLQLLAREVLASIPGGQAMHSLAHIVDVVSAVSIRLNCPVVDARCTLKR